MAQKDARMDALEKMFTEKISEMLTTVTKLVDAVSELDNKITTIGAQLTDLRSQKAKPKKVAAPKSEIPEAPTANVTRSRTNNINQVFKAACQGEHSTKDIARAFVLSHPKFGETLGKLKIDVADDYSTSDWGKIAQKFWQDFLTEPKAKTDESASAFRSKFLQEINSGVSHQMM